MVTDRGKRPAETVIPVWTNGKGDAVTSLNDAEFADARASDED